MRISVLTPSIRPEYLHITQKCLEQQTFTDFEWLVEVGLNNGRFTLPEDYNKMLRRAKGDIIVSLQDCISIPPDALERISRLDFVQKGYTFPVAKGGVWDWRKTRPLDESITGNMWEIDLAAAPRPLFFDIGGFDESFSDGWSFDNVEVGWRAEAAGYTFHHSRATEGMAIDHDALIPHPFREKLPSNAPKANETMERARHGKYRLNYLV